MVPNEEFTDEVSREDYDPEIVKEDLSQGLEELLEALPEYEKAYEYFDGKSKEKFITPDVQKYLYGTTTDFLFNLAGRVVLAVSDRMNISAVSARPADNGMAAATGAMNETSSASGGEEEEGEPAAEEEKPTAEKQVQKDLENEMQKNNPPSGEEEDDNSSDGASADNDSEESSGASSPEDTAFDESLTHVLNKVVWEDNEMDIEAPELHKTLLIYGDAYLFVWENSEDSDKVDIFCNSPMTTRLIYDDENPRKARFAIKRWKIGSGKEERIRVNLYYENFIVKKVTAPGSRGKNAADFQPYLRDEEVDQEGVVENPFGEIPVFHFRTSRPYGKPEHEQAYGPQDAITKLVSNLMTTVEFAAFPQRWALTRQSQDTDTDIDWGDSEDEDPEDKYSNLVSSPGSMWVLDNIENVGQFQASQSSNFLDPMDKCIELMAAVTGTPLSYLHKVRGTSSTPLSGKSQQATETILLKKIEDRERYCEASWKKALSFAMKVLGFEDVEISIKWDTLHASNDKETWDAVLAQQEAGVPIRQTLLEMNYDVALVESWGYTVDKPDGGKTKVAAMDPNDPFAQQANAPAPQELQSNQMQPGQQPPQGGMQNGAMDPSQTQGSG